MSDWTPPSEDWRLQLPTEPQAAVQYLCFAIVGPPEGQRCAKCNVVFNRDNRGWFSVQRMGKPGATVGYVGLYHCVNCQPDDTAKAVLNVPSWFPCTTEAWKFSQGQL